MMKTLLVSGCSITHGTELYNGFMSPENIKHSFSAHLANRLNLNLVNVALAGGSNEYIFHSVVKELDKHKNIDSVIAVWASMDRLYWKSNDRHWFFLPSWTCSVGSLEDIKLYDKTVNGVRHTGDSEEVLLILEKMHKFFLLNYYDSAELREKVVHYKKVLSDMCGLRDIKFVNLDSSTLRNIGNWSNEKRHPNMDEHKQIADFIFNRFYKDKHNETS